MMRVAQIIGATAASYMISLLYAAYTRSTYIQIAIFILMIPILTAYYRLIISLLESVNRCAGCVSEVRHQR